jgi:hypothetical protein
MAVSSFGGSVYVLDCGAVTADLGVDTDESLADRGVWRYGPEMTGFPPGLGDGILFKLDADFFENNSCRDGFLSLFISIDGVGDEGESGVRVPSVGKAWKVDGEKFGRERTGMDRRLSAPAGGEKFVVDLGNCTGPMIGIGLLMTGLRGVVGDSSIGGSAMRGTDPCSCPFFAYELSSTERMGKCASDERADELVVEVEASDSAEEVRRGGDVECECTSCDELS